MTDPKDVSRIFLSILEFSFLVQTSEFIMSPTNSIPFLCQVGWYRGYFEVRLLYHRHNCEISVGDEGLFKKQKSDQFYSKTDFQYVESKVDNLRPFV